MFNKFHSKVVRSRNGKVFIDFHDINKALLVLGSPRSGTTWISNLINYKNEYRYLMEPFRYRAGVNYMKGYPLFWYIPPDMKNQEYSHLFSRILSGRISLDGYNHKLIATKRLLKSVTAHFLIEWLISNYEIPLVFILRHPLAVAASRMKFQEKDKLWIPDFSSILNQNQLMEDYLAPFEKLILGENSYFENHLIYTCVQNFVALEQLKRIPHHIVFYENVVDDPLQEIKKIRGFLHQPFYARDERLVQTMVNKRFMMGEATIGDPLMKWQERLSSQQIERGEEIMEMFGLDSFYSAYKPRPIISIGSL